MFEKLKSRKFWLGVIGAVLPVVMQALTGQVGWFEALGLSLSSMIAAIFGLSLEDAAKQKAKALASVASAVPVDPS